MAVSLQSIFLLGLSRIMRRITGRPGGNSPLPPAPTFFYPSLKKFSDDQYLKLLNFHKLFVANEPMQLFFYQTI